MIIVDRDPVTADPASLKDIRVLETIKDGETVYVSR
jgi:predicted amidohydrolase YtcJ